MRDYAFGTVALAVLLGFASCPVPNPAPTPTPAPTVAPTAGPTPTPAPAGCGLPPGGGDSSGCRREGPTLRFAIDEALDEVGRTMPALVDVNDVRPGGSETDWRIRPGKSAQYHAAVVALLRAHKFCADFDGEEVAVKWDNSYSEQFDVETATGYSIRLYTATCRPALSSIP